MPKPTFRVLFALNPTSEQVDALNETVEQFNRAVQFVAGFAFANHIFSPHDLQRKVYSSLRTEFKLTSQMAIHAISEASCGCRAAIRNQHGSASPQIGKITSMVYDRRTMSLKGVSSVSLRCLGTREVITADPFFVLYGFSADSARSLGQGELFVCEANYYLIITVDTSHRSPDRILNIIQETIKFAEEWPQMPDGVRAIRNVPALYQTVQPDNPQTALDALYAASERIAPKLLWKSEDLDKRWTPSADTELTAFATLNA